MRSMTSKLYCLFAAFGMMLLFGCYPSRNTFRYDDFKELTAQESAIMEMSTISEAEKDARLRAALKPYENRSSVYTINSGDTISVTVYNNPDLSIGRTLVTTDGCISLVLAGQVKVAGMTLDEAARAIEKALSKYIINPKVGISPLEIHSETAVILGAVSKPGLFTISSDMRLTDLYALAGGSSTRPYDGQWLDAVDLNRGTFIRDGKALPIDFVKAIEQGDPLNNVKLFKGDYVYIPAKDDAMVYLIGDVKSPQRRVWTRGLGLLEFLAACGWVNETYWHHAIIIRGGIAKPRLYKVDLDGILQGRKANVLLEPSDVVYLPHDDISEYNVFVRKLIPSFQLFNLMMTPAFLYTRFI